MDKETENQRYIIGIDEVGRGPIAGPVAVCSFKCEPNFFDSISINTPLRDSKKLTKKQREKWFEYLKEEKEKGSCDFAVSMVSAEWIDKVDIVRSIKKALDSSLKKVVTNPKEVYVYLDGGLKAPLEFINQETVIKGDELYHVISCASIIAKVSRDGLMTKYAKEYPEYGFENHAGYGTKAHYEAIKKHGLTVLHRKSFMKNFS
jgi:ribonuclease HII